ncbi:hypothetical protein KQH41_00090 [bacterium]|nr:hypothetical protein [bacterium]
MIETLFILLLAIISVLILYFFAKNTQLLLNLREGSVWSLLLYKEYFLVFLPLLLVLTFGVQPFENALLNTDNKDVFRIALISSFSVIIFTANLVIFAIIFKVNISRVDRVMAILDVRVKRFVDAALLLALFLYLFSSMFLSYNHAFLSSIFSGESILTYRLENVYASRLPTQLSYLIILAAYLSSIYAPFLVLRDKRLAGTFYFILAIFLSSSQGDKAPVLISLFLFTLSYLSITGTRVTLKTLFKIILLFLPILYFAAYLVSSLQIPDITFNDFNIYLVNRLGVGQMSGVFETFSIPKIEGTFYWHAIPFASFFVDYVPYDKELMMIVEGFDYESMGVKNSLFISEAYGMGGWPMVIISPFILAFSYALGMKLLFIYLRFLYGNPVATLFAVPLYLVSAPITGGFSSFVFFKGLIFNMIHLFFIFFVFRLLSLFDFKKTIEPRY